MTPVLLVQNSPTSGSGRLDGWLADAGVEPRLTPGAELPPDLGGLAGLVLLGGGFVPDDDERHPWLAQERSLVSQALTAEVPILGICLGGQILAHVAGGSVTPQSGEGERGMCGLRMLPAAATDPPPTHRMLSRYFVDPLDDIPQGRRQTTLSPRTRPAR